MLGVMKAPLTIGKNAILIWIDSHAFIHAAALAFFTIFSMAPIIIVAVTFLGVWLGPDAAQGLLFDQLESVVGAKAATFVQAAVANSQLDRQGLLPTILGVGLIVLGATTVFAQLKTSLNSIWSVAAKPSKSSVLIYIKTRIISLTLVLSIGFILLASMLLSIAVKIAIIYAQSWLPISDLVLVSLEFCVSFLVISALFCLIFTFLPDVKLGWREVVMGGIVTSLLFSIGRYAIGSYLANTATSSTYGAAGSLVILLIWVNYSALILLFGAAITRAQLEYSGKRVVPSSSGVVVKKQLIDADF